MHSCFERYLFWQFRAPHAGWKSRPDDMVPKQCPFRRPTIWYLVYCATCLGSRDNSKYLTHIHTYMTQVGFPSIVWLRLRAFGAQPPSELLRSCFICQDRFQNQLFYQLSSFFTWMFSHDLYQNQLSFSSYHTVLQKSCENRSSKEAYERSRVKYWTQTRQHAIEWVFIVIYTYVEKMKNNRTQKPLEIPLPSAL